VLLPMMRAEGPREMGVLALEMVSAGALGRRVVSPMGKPVGLRV